MLRQRKALVAEAAKELDAFFKLEEDYQETSSARGTISIIVYLIITVLVILEINFFFTKQVNYSYEVDFDHDSKLNMNVDITVAMPCAILGPDVMDATSRDILTDQTISMDDTWFEMSPRQQQNFDRINMQNINLRENYHSLHSAYWRASSSMMRDSLGEREVLPHRPKDACRIHGTFELNKIAGNFHIIYGRSVSFFGNHAHITNLFDRSPKNFSHRIDHLSFGELDEDLFMPSPLNFELKVTTEPSTSFQYFVSVVTTQVNSKNSYQYSVTEKHRVVDHEQGSHGTAGILFKYDISPLKVNVRVSYLPWLELVIPLIGIIGGIFSTSAMINSLYQSIKDFLTVEAK